MSEESKLKDLDRIDRIVEFIKEINAYEDRPWWLVAGYDPNKHHILSCDECSLTRLHQPCEACENSHYKPRIL